MGKSLDAREGSPLSRASFRPIENDVFQLSIRDLALKPGNLVHGVVALRREDWKKLLTTGIQAPMHTGAYSFTDNQICFAMLSESELPERYEIAGHRGPKPRDTHGNDTVLSIGIVVETSDVLKAFPTQTFAVGQAFDAQHLPERGARTPDNMMGKQFAVDQQARTVYGVPMGIPNDFYVTKPSAIRRMYSVRYPQWEDEVKVLFPLNDAPDEIKAQYRTEGSVRPSAWRGIVVPDEKTLEVLVRWTEDDKLPLPILLPIYSTDFEHVSDAFMARRK